MRKKDFLYKKMGFLKNKLRFFRYLQTSWDIFRHSSVKVGIFKNINTHKFPLLTQLFQIGLRTEIVLT